MVLLDSIKGMRIVLRIPTCLLKTQITPAHITRTVLTEISVGEDVVLFNATFHNMKFYFHNVTIYRAYSYSI